LRAAFPALSRAFGARLNASLPGLARDIAQALVEEAHQLCPCSRATRGNVEVAITLV